jgi:UDP:flavonoid glycosyltransferase YjiC (YdhE family)
MNLVRTVVFPVLQLLSGLLFFKPAWFDIPKVGAYLQQMRKKILITTFGFMGDLNPYIALARRLKKEAHFPIIATSEYYRAAVKKAGIDFYPIRPDYDAGNYELMSRIMQPKTGPQILIKEILLSHLQESYRDLLKAAQDSDLLITHPLTFAGPLVAEKTRVPWISTVLSPISFFSTYDFPVIPPYPYLKNLDFLAPWTGKLFLKLAHVMTRHLRGPIRQLRAEIGLRPGKDPIFEGQYSPGMTLGLFSPLLAKQRPDWPQGTRITGFLFYDKDFAEGTEDPESSMRLEKFLDSGPPPVVFTLGSSAVTASDEFYRDSFEAAKLLRIRAVLLAGKDLKNRPAEPLPDKIAVFEYASYSKVFPRAAAVVHHGGIGTTAQALRAGKPMLVVPFAFDQPDNALRLHRLGIARTIYRHRYSAGRVAGELKILLENPEYLKRAEEAGRAVRSENGQELACNAIKEIVG